MTHHVPSCFLPCVVHPVTMDIQLQHLSQTHQRPRWAQVRLRKNQPTVFVFCLFILRADSWAFQLSEISAVFFKIERVTVSLFCDPIVALNDGAEKALLEKVLMFFAKLNVAKVPALASLSQADLESSERWPTRTTISCASVHQEGRQLFSDPGMCRAGIVALHFPRPCEGCRSDSVH